MLPYKCFIGFHKHRKEVILLHSYKREISLEDVGTICSEVKKVLLLLLDCYETLYRIVTSNLIRSQGQFHFRSVHFLIGQNKFKTIFGSYLNYPIFENR